MIETDIPDLIAGALGVSRGTAYDMMREALAEQPRAGGTLAKQSAERGEPVAMRMPKVGDEVVCIEDDSLGTVAYLTAGGSPEIKFDDGSHGTYLLHEFVELFRYTTPQAQPAQPQPLPMFTTGHCKEKAKAGGCQLHNIQCGFPACDRKEA